MNEAAFDLRRIKALTWDVGGTVFDWHGTIRSTSGTAAPGQTYLPRWRPCAAATRSSC